MMLHRACIRFSQNLHAGRPSPPSLICSYRPCLKRKRAPVKVKLILPALVEAKSPLRRPVKYSLLPPLGFGPIEALISE